MGIQEAEICVQLDVTELKPVPGNRFRVSRVAHRLFYSEEVEANDESWESLCHDLSVDKTCTFYDLDDLDVVGEEYEWSHTHVEFGMNRRHVQRSVKAALNGVRHHVEAMYCT